MSNHDTIKYIWSYYNFHEKVWWGFKQYVYFCIAKETIYWIHPNKHIVDALPAVSMSCGSIIMAGLASFSSLSVLRFASASSNFSTFVVSSRTV